jgi:hypothetical protein
MQLKLALQYLLNVDELVPYEAWAYCPELKAKGKGVGARYFASYQDTIQPYDGYAFCQWMWEILFGAEDWHADIRNWVVVAPPVPVIR